MKKSLFLCITLLFYIGSMLQAGDCPTARMGDFIEDTFQTHDFTSGGVPKWPLYNLMVGNWNSNHTDTALMFSDVTQNDVVETRAVLARFEQGEWRFNDFAIDLGGMSHSARSRDLDGDGQLELITTQPWSIQSNGQNVPGVRISVHQKMNMIKNRFLHTDTTTFPVSSNLFSHFQVMADLDGDDLNDLVFVHENGTGKIWVTLFYSRLEWISGRVTPRITFQEPLSFETVVDDQFLNGRLSHGDFTGDGKDELVFTKTKRSSVNPLRVQVRMLELNADFNDPDAYLDNGMVYVLRMAGWWLDLDTRYDHTMVSDVDGNGRDNLVISGYGANSWFTLANIELDCDNQWAMAYQQPYSDPVKTDRKPRVGDLNADRRAEVMVAGHNLMGLQGPEGMYLRTWSHDDFQWRETEFIDTTLPTDLDAYFFSMDANGDRANDYVFFNPYVTGTPGNLQIAAIRTYFYETP